jgi:hypothetical protein
MIFIKPFSLKIIDPEISKKYQEKQYRQQILVAAITLAFIRLIRIIYQRVFFFLKCISSSKLSIECHFYSTDLDDSIRIIYFSVYSMEISS